MKKRRTDNKTIDLNTRKAKRSSGQVASNYFNPYADRVRSRTVKKDIKPTRRIGAYPPPSLDVPKRKEVSKKAVTKKAPNKSKANYNTQIHKQSSLDAKQQREQIRKRNKVTKAQLERNKKRRQRYFLMKVITVMFLTAFGVWGGIKAKEALTKPQVSTQVVKMGAMDTSKDLEGIVVRKEVVYQSDEAGMIQYSLAEGDKLKKDGVVYAIIDQANLDVAESQKEEIDTEIYNAADLRKDISYYQDDANQLNKVFADRMNDYYTNIYNQSTDYIYALRNQLDVNVSNRTSLYTKEQQDINEGLTEKIDTISSDLSKYKLVKKSDASGIISYMIDGKETLNREEVEQMTYDDYTRLSKGDEATSVAQGTIDAGAPVYKLVTDHTWHIVSYIPAKDEADYQEGVRYTLDFENGNSIAFTLEKKVEEDKRYKLVFTSSEQVGDFLSDRVIHFSIGNKAVEGLKIPLSAMTEKSMLKVPIDYIVEKDNMTGVYRKRDDVLDFVKLTVQYENDEMIYIAQDVSDLNVIQAGDIIVHPVSNETYTIDQFEIQSGVYVMNGKIAQFKEVEIDLQNDEYALIKNDGNNILKEKDRIISNPERIKENQLMDDMTIQNE